MIYTIFNRISIQAAAQAVVLKSGTCFSARKTAAMATAQHPHHAIDKAMTPEQLNEKSFEMFGCDFDELADDEKSLVFAVGGHTPDVAPAKVPTGAESTRTAAKGRQRATTEPAGPAETQSQQPAHPPPKLHHKPEPRMQVDEEMEEAMLLHHHHHPDVALFMPHEAFEVRRGGSAD